MTQFQSQWQQARLTNSAEITVVLRQGNSVKHRLGILCFRPNANAQQPSRFCYSASRRIGNAVKRNRAKRLLREAIRLHLPEIEPGWDCVFIARAATTKSDYATVEAAVLHLLSKANVITVNATS